MPGYGVLGPTEGTGLLAWAWAADRLTGSHDYWLATVRPGGAPHVTPVWAVWHRAALWFSASEGSRKARNLRADPRCTATTDDPANPVVVEGAAARVVKLADVADFAALLNEKYSTAYPVGFFAGNACFRLEPSWAFALATEDFAGSPTRWTFP